MIYGLARVLPATGYGVCGYGYGVGKPDPRVTRMQPYVKMLQQAKRGWSSRAKLSRRIKSASEELNMVRKSFLAATVLDIDMVNTIRVPFEVAMTIDRGSYIWKEAWLSCMNIPSLLRLVRSKKFPFHRCKQILSGCIIKIKR